MQCLETPVRKRGGPVMQPPGVIGGKRTRQLATKSFQAQVLANLAALEDDVGETLALGTAMASGGVLMSDQKMDRVGL